MSICQFVHLIVPDRGDQIHGRASLLNQISLLAALLYIANRLRGSRVSIIWIAQQEHDACKMFYNTAE